jgi:hypothetical protein
VIAKWKARACVCVCVCVCVCDQVSWRGSLHHDNTTCHLLACDAPQGHNKMTHTLIASTGHNGRFAVSHQRAATPTSAVRPVACEVLRVRVGGIWMRVATTTVQARRVRVSEWSVRSSADGRHRQQHAVVRVGNRVRATRSARVACGVV